MRRRSFISSTLAATIAGTLQPRLSFARLANPDWSELRRQIGDRLIDVHSPLVECRAEMAAPAPTSSSRKSKILIISPTSRR